MSVSYEYKKEKAGVVFPISAFFVICFVIWGFFAPSHLEDTTSTILQYITHSFGWFYILVTSLVVAFCLFLAFGPFRHVKLGKRNDQPEFSYFAWVGMLFSAGMGVGLVFWGIAEPMSHFSTPPNGIEPESTDAAIHGLLYGVFHWGMHPWAVYALVGMALALMKYRKELPGLISSIFYPLLGDKMSGPLGKGIDVTATVGTSIGIATSFGLSTLQLSGGLEQLFGLTSNNTLYLTIIAVITLIYMISVWSGISRGMKYLSEFNLALSGVLLVLLLVVGPTVFVLDHIIKTSGMYISHFVTLSFDTMPYADGDWLGEWTIFYWAWVIVWSPFVGTFIARISRGRTIQQFVLGVLFIPTIGTILWFVVFGGSALYYEIFEGADLASPIQDDPEAGLFLFLDLLPFGTILSLLALLLTTIFFITSANSATFVLGVLTSKGSLNPTNTVMTVWGVLIAAVSGAVLISGGLDGLQSAAIIAALPFTFLLILIIVCVLKYLKNEQRYSVEREEQ
ncbi:glycine betaine transporter OpuD [Halalkalibacter wakoensis JCM 9140]|uniref:Glycine betaine transporter OpuD n=1 Tax=Halalkalibacter wakoensis JCM 9140 TaxID=1236970 RepID=W4Q6S2_9BACI|nr:BCCT family transporter [Halalkalibacter wakoensis]GAE27064.1 glycine betaine transporter OpuD [Halalkalibacter wakoensis JCM 9140]